MKEVNNFLLYISRKKVQPRVEDKVAWAEEKNGYFSLYTWGVPVGSFAFNKNGYFLVNSLVKALNSAPSCYFPARMVWQSKLQPRVCFFAWEVAWGKVLTLDQL